MRDVYLTLRAWFERTFGKQRDPYVMVEKLKEELKELEIAVDNYERWTNHPNRVIVQKEMADIMILIINMATNYNMCYDTFLDSIRIKHSINVKRKWKKMPDGTFKHLPDDTKNY